MHSCNICDYNSPYSWNLKRHMKQHENVVSNDNDNNTCCRFCLREFTFKHNRKRHETTCKHRPSYAIVEATNNKGIVAPCHAAVAPIPSNVASIPSNVAPIPSTVAPSYECVANAEMKEDNHQNEKIECALCYKTFANRWNLQHHVNTCKGLAHPFMCPKCRIVCVSRYAKCRHVKKCDGTRNENAVIIIPNNASSANGQLAHPSSGTGQIINISINNLQINNNNLQVNNKLEVNGFGNEDLTEILKSEYLDERLKETNGGGVF